MNFQRHVPSVVIVDNFFEKPDEVRAFGLSQEFSKEEKYFKGQRSKTRHLWPGLKEEFERLLNKKITLWEEYATNGVFQFCIGGDQIVYHSDEQTHAGVIYLTPDAPPESGTSIVRSKNFKARTIEEALKVNKIEEKYSQEVLEVMYGGKLLDPTAWECVDVMGNVYNRLVLWNARQVHHASCYFGWDKNNSRFFQIFFFSVES